MVAKHDPSLADAIEKARIDYLTRSAAKRRLPREFLDGIVKGFGMAVGGTIVFGIVLYFLGRFIVIPEAREWIDGVTQNAAMFSR